MLNMMNDYCARESTLNSCEDEIRNSTIKNDIQETFEILCETKSVLQEFATIINGNTHDDNAKKDANCLWEEARMMTALAYENLQKLLEIKGSII